MLSFRPVQRESIKNLTRTKSTYSLHFPVITKSFKVVLLINIIPRFITCFKTFYDVPQDPRIPQYVIYNPGVLLPSRQQNEIMFNDMLQRLTLLNGRRVQQHRDRCSGPPNQILDAKQETPQKVL